MRRGPYFEIDVSIEPHSCVPVGFDWSGMVDITCVGDRWRKYLHIESGRIHDGAEYHHQLMEMEAAP